jgi:UDP-GlcNAc:undecaprenyl-phosphate GlcNAc-1-phosphate transferase
MLTISQYFLLTILFFILIFINNKYRFNIGNLIRLIDKPDKKRKLHKFDTPLNGLFPFIVIILIYSQLINTENNYFSNIILISILFFILGLIDDIFTLSYKNKFLISILILLIFLLLNKNFLISKIFIESFSINKQLIINHSTIITILCVLILINAFNFTDGINGLSSIIASLWLLSLAIFDFKINYHLIFLSILILINSIPIYNGKYFLGDNGTLFLGSLISFETINLFNTNLDKISYEQIFLIFMIPGFDMIRLIFLRLKNKKNPFLPDNNHLHHLLIKKYFLNKTLLIYSCLIFLPILIGYFTSIKTILNILLFLVVYTLLIINLKKN